MFATATTSDLDVGENLDKQLHLSTCVVRTSGK